MSEKTFDEGLLEGMSLTILGLNDVLAMADPTEVVEQIRAVFVQRWGAEFPQDISEILKAYFERVAVLQMVVTLLQAAGQQDTGKGNGGYL